MARRRFAKAIAAAALSLALLTLIGCVSSAPTPAAEIAEQARVMTPLQIRMSDSIGRMLTDLAASEEWKVRPSAITLHDRVVVLWFDGRITGPELASARAAVSDWLQQYQGAGINTLEFKDYTTGEAYGKYAVIVVRPQTP